MVPCLGAVTSECQESKKELARHDQVYTEALTTETEGQISKFMEDLEISLGELERSIARLIRERAELLVRAAVAIDRKEEKRV